MNAALPEINWSDWCEPLSSRYDLSKPFVHDGVMYATDRRKAIRVQCPGEPDTPPHETKKRPNVGEIFPDFSIYSEWQDFPPETAIVSEIGDCPDCDGYGFTEFKDCPDCDGTGEDECFECGNVETCEECDGEGEIGSVKCTRCDKGKCLREDHVMFGPIKIQAKFYRQCLALPNAKWCPHDGAILVKFDGGEAMVMGLVY